MENVIRRKEVIVLPSCYWVDRKVQSILLWFNREMRYFTETGIYKSGR